MNQRESRNLNSSVIETLCKKIEVVNSTKMYPRGEIAKIHLNFNTPTNGH